MKNIPIRQFIANFQAGMYNTLDVRVQCQAGWYDWFCTDRALMKKTVKLGNFLIKIADSPKINQDTMYVFFKNNCPMNGSLYDDFRICDLETGNVIFTIVPKSGHRSENGCGFVYDFSGSTSQEHKFSSWGKIAKWFNDK